MSKKRFELLTDAQWELIGPLLPEPKRRKDRRGRPWVSNRACLEGILWVLQTGAAWRFLPEQYPSPATCWRRLKRCGKSKRCGWMHGERCWVRSTAKAC